MKTRKEDFEAGDNITDQLHQGKPDGMVVSVRLAKEDSDKLVNLAEESGRTVSQVARQAIRVFLVQRGPRLPVVPEITGTKRNVDDVISAVPVGSRSSGVKPTVTQRRFDIGAQTTPTGYDPVLV